MTRQTKDDILVYTILGLLFIGGLFGIAFPILHFVDLVKYVLS